MFQSHAAALLYNMLRLKRFAAGDLNWRWLKDIRNGSHTI